jgi:hypothetical protein
MVPIARTCRSPMRPARSASAGKGGFHVGVVRYIEVAGHGPDGDGAAVFLDAGEFLDAAQGPPAARARRACSFMEARSVWPPASGLAPAAGQLGRIGHGGGPFECEGIHGVVPSLFSVRGGSLHRFPDTRWGEAGMSKSFTPSGASASSKALITAGGEPMAPASPQPLVPSGLCVHGVHTVSSLNCGKSAALRHGVVHEAAGEQLAGFVVVHAVFEQRLADALHQPAVHLALDDHRVDDGAEVVDRGEAVDA